VDYPPPINAYLLNRAARHLHLAYFLLDAQGRIIRWGGDVDHYRMGVPRKGLLISDLLVLTEGIFPLGGVEMILECVEMHADLMVDAHLFEADGRPWLLLLDASEKAENRRLLQQKANELTLLRDTHARILDQHLGKGMAERLLNIDFQKGGDRRELSVLFADIRGFSTYCEHRPPSQVVEMLNAYLTAMIRPVLDGGGIVDKIIGDAVMAVFGILPSGLTAAGLAFAVAREILKASDAVAADRKAAGRHALGVGVGIATGSVVMGVLGSKDRRALSVTGHSVNLAARLENCALSREILMDERTFDLLERDRDAFASRVLDLKGLGSPITAYSWVAHHDG
jgi:class 3 adenylate cyclase